MRQNESSHTNVCIFIDEDKDAEDLLLRQGMFHSIANRYAEIAMQFYVLLHKA